MSLFSQRKGFRPLQKTLQRESMDADLRNRLWSAMQISIWDKWSAPTYYGTHTHEALAIRDLVRQIWLHHFKQPLDTIPNFESAYPKSAYEVIRDHFLNGKWWEVYDFLEFVLKASPEAWSKDLRESSNIFLEAENSAYRIIDDEIVEITDKTEIDAIESAIEGGTNASSTHLQRAVELLSDRKQPDFRNSIKESISAVESVCQTLTGNKKATLGDCLKLMKGQQALHGAFEQALQKLYGYTSDDGGIRHALVDGGQQPSYSDAKFMLVACSAFTNFLWTKAAELGLNVK